MRNSKTKKNSWLRSAGQYVVIGLLTAAPLAITWLILSFLFSQLSSLGAPWVRGLARGIRPEHPFLAELMLNETFLSIIAVLIVLASLYILGWSAGRVLGQKLIQYFEAAIGAIPFVDAIYHASKRLLVVVGGMPEAERRVVLVNFPSSEMKVIGLVTHMLRDSETGEELAAVYVPTAPNPTSGYIEIVPARSITFTDWTFDEAMAFIVTGGSSAPTEINYSGSKKQTDSAP